MTLARFPPGDNPWTIDFKHGKNFVRERSDMAIGQRSAGQLTRLHPVTMVAQLSRNLENAP